MAVQHNYTQNILIAFCLLNSYIYIYLYIFTDVISSHRSALPDVNVKGFGVINLLNYAIKLQAIIHV